MPSPEYWLRGPITGVPALLQPVAHALLQAREEIEECLAGFPNELLWQQPAGKASVGFHLQHIRGVLDRLFTYAKGEQLNAEQLTFLAAEGKQDAAVSINTLVKNLNEQVDKCINELKNTKEHTLTETRGVGRKQIPSTVMGLLFHAAEHTMRHLGQLLVTVSVLKHKEFNV